MKRLLFFPIILLILSLMPLAYSTDSSGTATVESSSTPVYVAELSVHVPPVFQIIETTFTITVTKDDVAYANYVCNVTENGESLKTNVSESFTYFSLMFGAYTYDISSLIDLGTNESVDFNTTSLSVYWETLPQPMGGDGTSSPVYRVSVTVIGIPEGNQTVSIILGQLKMGLDSNGTAMFNIPFGAYGITVLLDEKIVYSEVIIVEKDMNLVIDITADSGTQLSIVPSEPFVIPTWALVTVLGVGAILFIQVIEYYSEEEKKK